MKWLKVWIENSIWYIVFQCIREFRQMKRLEKSGLLDGVTGRRDPSKWERVSWCDSSQTRWMSTSAVPLLVSRSREYWWRWLWRKTSQFCSVTSHAHVSGWSGVRRAAWGCLRAQWCSPVSEGGSERFERRISTLPWTLCWCAHIVTRFRTIRSTTNTFRGSCAQRAHRSARRWSDHGRLELTAVWCRCWYERAFHHESHSSALCQFNTDVRGCKIPATRRRHLGVADNSVCTWHAGRARFGGRRTSGRACCQSQRWRRRWGHECRRASNTKTHCGQMSVLGSTQTRHRIRHESSCATPGEAFQVWHHRVETSLAVPARHDGSCTEAASAKQSLLNAHSFRRQRLGWRSTHAQVRIFVGDHAGWFLTQRWCTNTVGGCSVLFRCRVHRSHSSHERGEIQPGAVISLRSTRQHRFAFRKPWRHWSRKQKRVAVSTWSRCAILVTSARNSPQEGPNQQSARTRERGRRKHENCRPTFAQILPNEHGCHRDSETVARHSPVTWTQSLCHGLWFISENGATASTMAAEAERRYQHYTLCTPVTLTTSSRFTTRTSSLRSQHYTSQDSYRYFVVRHM